jgi:hypothetical protein
LNQSGHMRPSIIRVANQPSIVIIICYKELFPDRRSYVRYEITRITFLPFRETINHMKFQTIVNINLESWRSFALDRASVL